jgi:hypothetical protein
VDRPSANPGDRSATSLTVRKPPFEQITAGACTLQSCLRRSSHWLGRIGWPCDNHVTGQWCHGYQSGDGLVDRGRAPVLDLTSAEAPARGRKRGRVARLSRGAG